MLWAHERDSEPQLLVEFCGLSRDRLLDALEATSRPGRTQFDPRRRAPVRLSDLPRLSGHAEAALRAALDLSQQVSDPPATLPLRFLFGGMLLVPECGAYIVLDHLLGDRLALPEIASSYVSFLERGPNARYDFFLKELEPPASDPTLAEGPQVQLEGIDVSASQPVTDWPLVADAGLDFVATQATEGIEATDPTFTENWHGMRDAKIPVRVAIHSLTEGQDGSAQADHCVATVRAAGGLGPGEAAALAIGRASEPGADALASLAAAWVTRVEEASRKKPLVCADADTFASFGQLGGADVETLKRCPVWLVAHGSSFTPPAEWAEPVIWQYSDGAGHAAIPGVSGLPHRDRLLVQVPVFAEITRTARREIDIDPSASSDQPTSDDTLGFGPLVEGLDALVNAPKTRLPLAIAVTAEWGAGKSSVMLQLQARLRARLQKRRSPGQVERRWYTVNFPAWKYERSDLLWAALAKTIYRDVQNHSDVNSNKQMSRWERIRFRFRVERRRQSTTMLLAKTLAPTLAVAAGIGASANQLGVSLGSLTLPVALAPLAALATLAAAIGRYWGVVSEPFSRAIDAYAKRSTDTEGIGFTPDANDDVNEMIDALIDPGRRTRKRRASSEPQPALAVFVDDLDRCTPRHVVDVVECINQIFNSVENRPCLFVLGMDQVVVASSIDVVYADTIARLEASGSGAASAFGLRFLGKLVQLSVAIPRPSDDALVRLLEQTTDTPSPTRDRTADPSVELVDEYRKKIQAASPTNPADVPAAVRRITSGDRATGADAAALTEATRQVQALLLSSDAPDVARAIYEALPNLGGNPRQIKRFSNAFRLQLYVANRSTDIELDFTPDQLSTLAKWVALRLRWPDLAVAVDARPGLLDSLELAANSPTSVPPPVDPEPAGQPVDPDRKWFADESLMTVLREPDINRRLTATPAVSQALLRLI